MKLTQKLNRFEISTLLINLTTVIPGQANYILDGSSEEGVTLSAWHVSYVDYTKIAEALTTLPNETVSATLNPSGKI